MEQEPNNGKTVLNTLANGNLTKPVDKENSGMLMVIFLKGLGLTIKRTDSVFILTKMEQNTKAIGKTICSTGRAKSRGRMALDMKESIAMARNMDKAITFGTMVQSMMGSGLITKLKDMGSTNGRMVVYSRDIG